MFEEIEASSYHILVDKIKSYIENISEKVKGFENRADAAIACGLEYEYDYFDGRAHALKWVISDLNSIIKTVERVTKKELDYEFKKFDEYLESEIAADSARSKQL